MGLQKPKPRADAATGTTTAAGVAGAAASAGSRGRWVLQFAWFGAKKWVTAAMASANAKMNFKIIRTHLPEG